MICKKCGKEVADDTKYCPFCGAKVEAEEAPAEEVKAAEPAETKAEETPAAETPAEAQAAPVSKEPATETATSDPVPTTVDPSVAVKATGKKVADALRKIPAKVWGICVAIIVAIFVICGIASCAGDKSPFITDAAKDGIIYASGDKVMTLNGKKITIEEGVRSSKSNYNSTVYVVLDNDYVLWLVNTKKAVKIAADIAYYDVSFYGDTVVYMQKDGDDYVVSAYDVSKKKSKKIFDKSITNVVFSTDGKAVLFNSEGDLYISKKGGAAKKEYSDARPVAVTNNGKTIFYTKNEKLYANDDKLCNTSELGRMAFTINQDEVLFSANGSTYYYTVKFKEPVKIKSDSFYEVVTAPGTVVDTQGSAYIYGMKTFNGCVINMESSLYYMAKKGEKVEKVVSSFTDYVMSEDGKSIVYISSGDVFKVASVKKASEPKRIGKDVEAKYLYANSNLKAIYFATSDKELRYLKSNGKGEMITDDVDSQNVVYDNKIKCIVYLNRDDELYAAKTTKKSRHKLSVGDPMTIMPLSNGKDVYVFTADENRNVSIYKVTSVKKVKRVAKLELNE